MEEPKKKRNMLMTDDKQEEKKRQTNELKNLKKKMGEHFKKILQGNKMSRNTEENKNDEKVK